jgi:Ca2+-binding EF-hand superfamily protein
MTMKVSRGLTLGAAVCAVLLASVAVDAKGSKNKKSQAAASAVQACDGSGAGGMMNGKAGPGGPFAGTEPFALRYFDEIDADQNGQLSREEISAWVTARRAQFEQEMQARFQAADTNGDGLLSQEEARLGMPRLYEHFQFVDANGDGYVSLAELDMLRDRDQLHDRIQDRLRAADANGDGQLDLAEVQVAFPGLATRFALLDANGDGVLTLDELLHPLGPG